MPRVPSILLFVLLLLAGCSVTNPVPPAAVSPPTPAPVIELPPATITGSEESSTMLDSFTAFVTAVNDVPVAAGRQGWNTPLTLKAGPRRLAVTFNRGVFTARAELPLIARSEAVYQVRFATDAQLFGRNSYCEFWIVDAATGQPATERVRVPLTKIEVGQ